MIYTKCAVCGHEFPSEDLKYNKKTSDLECKSCFTASDEKRWENQFGVSIWEDEEPDFFDMFLEEEEIIIAKQTKREIKKKEISIKTCETAHTIAEYPYFDNHGCAKCEHKQECSSYQWSIRKK
jgi:hypothetical protein